MSRFGVDADVAQELAGTVLADFSSIDIEQYGERTAAFYLLIVRFHDDSDLK